MKPAYHELMALLGVGDLHPGGVPATEFLLGELAKASPRTVLEVGAGAGRTTERMLKRGWRVTAVEPSAVMCARLEARCGISARQASFESFDAGEDRFDAVIGESVFYALEPRRSVAKIRGLLRPGGLLALSDMIWTDAATADAAASVHDRTAQAFGIPMAPRDARAWAGWRSALGEAGFEEIVTRRVEPGAGEPARWARRARVALGLLTHPGLFPLYLSYRAHQGRAWAPQGWLESWLSIWRRAGA
jgi:SAM-dependent methyltransferase